MLWQRIHRANTPIGWSCHCSALVPNFTHWSPLGFCKSISSLCWKYTYFEICRMSRSHKQSKKNLVMKSRKIQSLNVTSKLASTISYLTCCVLFRIWLKTIQCKVQGENEKVTADEDLFLLWRVWWIVFSFWMGFAKARTGTRVKLTHELETMVETHVLTTDWV